MPGCRRWSGRFSGGAPRRRRRLGRSPGDTSGSCAAGRRSHWPPSSGTTTRTSDPWPASSPCSTRVTRHRRRAKGSDRRRGRPRPGVRPGAPAGGGPVSTRSSSGPTNRSRRPSRSHHPSRPGSWRRGRTCRGGRRGPGRTSADRLGGRSRPVELASDRRVRRDLGIQRIALDRAHLLRRPGRYPEAAEAWTGVAAGPGGPAIVGLDRARQASRASPRRRGRGDGGDTPRDRRGGSAAAARDAGARAGGRPVPSTRPPAAASRGVPARPGGGTVARVGSPERHPGIHGQPRPGVTEPGMG